MRSRSWRWLRTRIEGLLSAPVAREVFSGEPIFTTRLQAALVGPAPARTEPTTRGSSL